MKNKSSIHNQQVFTDLRELEKHISKLQFKKEKEESLFYIHKIPELPAWTNKVYNSQGYKQNLHKLKCNCGEQRKLSKKYFNRDIRLLCRHLYWKLTTTKAKDEIDELTKLLLSSLNKNKEMNLFKTSLKYETLILGFTNSKEWVNIFIGKEKWKRFAFNIVEKRWAYSESPKNAKLVETKINSVLDYIFN